MKMKRRISIEYRHREVTIAVAGSVLHVQDSEPDAANAPAVCPTCGSLLITVAARTEGDTPYTLDRMSPVLQQSGLHLQVSPTGQLQICQRSLKEIKETF